MTKKETSKSTYKEILTSLIDPPSEVSRLEIPESEIIELAESIKEQGLLQPISVFEKDGRHEIVFGHRRWLAHRYLKRGNISCKIVENNPKENALARATENKQRSNLSPFEEGMEYQALAEKHGMTYVQIAKRMGISAGMVKRRVNILKMPDSLIDSIHKKLISPTVAEELMRCPDEGHRAYLIDMSKEHGVTAIVARGWVDDFLRSLRTMKDVDSREGQSPDVYIETPVFVACQACKQAKEISQLKSIGVCPECFKNFITMLESGAFKK